VERYIDAFLQKAKAGDTTFTVVSADLVVKEFHVTGADTPEFRRVFYEERI